jgi:O-methyltransferase
MTWEHYTIVPFHELLFLNYQFTLLPPGDVIVAGTYRGGDVMFIQDRDPSRNIVVIDSFQGVHDPTELDGDNGHLRGEFACGGLEEYKANFAAAGREPPEEIYEMFITFYHLYRIQHRPIALMWLDLDHFQPTLDCLAYFENDMVPGGVILSHDYGNPKCPGIQMALEAFGREYSVYGTVARVAMPRRH